MENKVRFDGVILNEVKLTDFGGSFLRVQNKKPYFDKKSNTQKESILVMPVPIHKGIAQDVVKRFKKGDLVRVEGSLINHNTKKLDQEGLEIWERWLQAQSVNALPNGGSINVETRQKPIEIKPTGSNYVAAPLPQKPPYQAPKQPTSVLKKQPIQAPVEDTNNVFEEVYDNDLPF